MRAKMVELLTSRKFWLTVAAIIVALTHNDYAAALDALLLLVGVQGGVDIAAKLRAPAVTTTLSDGTTVHGPVSLAFAKQVDQALTALRRNTRGGT